MDNENLQKLKEFLQDSRMSEVFIAAEELMAEFYSEANYNKHASFIEELKLLINKI